MAAIQLIRKHGKVLASIVGLALFAFVAEEAVRSMSSQSAEARQEIGDVCDETLHYPEFHNMVEEMSNVYGVPNDEDTQASLRNEVWSRYVYEKLIQQECDAAGLMVTDAEMEQALKDGNFPDLYLQRLPQYLVQYIYDASLRKVTLAKIQQMRDSYKAVLDNAAQYPNEYVEQALTLQSAWNYAEKHLRFGLLETKYLALMQGSVLTNKVSAKMAFDATNTHSTILLAALPYSTLNDSDVEVTDADRKAAYDELKENFVLEEELRTVEMIDVQVRPSEEDRANLAAEVEEAAAALAAEAEGNANYNKVVRENKSTVNYIPLPVKKSSLPADVQARIDSIAVGTTVAPYTSMDREQTGNRMTPYTMAETRNTFRLNATATLPDSVEFRTIAVGGLDLAAAHKSADSIVAAIKGGAPFDTIAARYNQEGNKVWFTGDAYEQSNEVFDAQAVSYINSIMNNAVGSFEVIERGNYCVVLNVTDRKAFTTKYDVAVVKRKLEFSTATYTNEYNKFSQFLAENRTAENIREKAADNGYMLQTLNVKPSDNGIGGIHRTGEIQRWALNEDTKVGNVSKLHECGDNDQFIVVILTDIAPKGYISADNQNIKPQVDMVALQNAKAAKLTEQLKGKTAAQAASVPGAVTDTVTYVSFANPVSVSRIGAQEVALTGAVAGLEKGKSTSPVKGSRGVYVATVLDTQKGAAAYDEAQEMQNAQGQLMGYTNVQTLMQGLFNDLRRAANVTDRRYIFY